MGLTKLKGWALVAVLVISSGAIGGVLASLLGGNQAEVLIFAVGFSLLSYAILSALVFSAMYSALKMIQRLNDDK